MKFSVLSVWRILFLAFMLVNPVIAQRLEVYVDYKRFTTPDHKGLLEVYMQVNPLSTKLYQDKDSLYYAELEVTEIIRKGDNIVDFSKRVVESRHMPDSMIADIMDQERFRIPPGVYELELIIRDLHLDSLNTVKSVLPFAIKTDSSRISISDIQPVESIAKADTIGPLTKSGYNMMPYVSNYYPPEVEKIAFYAEIYNTDLLGADEKFAMFQYIEDGVSGKQLSDFTRYSKQTAKAVIPVLGALDIKNLQPGNYNLVIELRNKENEIIVQRKWNFQRNNYIFFSLKNMLSLDIKATFVEKFPDDSLNEYISCLRPIAQADEIIVIDTIVNSTNLSEKRKFIYSFWSARDGNNPEYEWLDYKTAVDRVQIKFGTPIKRGYMTDRGAIFLKYGSPDYVYDKANEPSAYPYQIWQYKKVGKYNNKRFIFYLPDLVTNDYMLLHSEIPGEIKNYDWQKVLNGRNNTNTNVDDGSSPNIWGGNANQMFQNPR